MACEKKKVAVCGTCFGEHYLAAIAAKPERYELSAIVARGSERSRALAAHFEVPLYRDVCELPGECADIACVVVRSRLFGGEGSRLAEACLDRGMHVLQEHPVHPGEVAALKRKARERGRCYHVNGFYAHLPAPGTFIDYVRKAAVRGVPAYCEMTTSPQLLYSTLDILGRAIGGLGDLQLFGPLAAQADRPFHAFQGIFGGVPFSLMLQAYLDPADPDHHSLVMHRMAIGWPEGSVNLINSFGPAFWTHALFAPDYRADGLASSYLLSPDGFATNRYFTQPSAVAFGPVEDNSFWQVVHRQFPQAINRALDDLRLDAENGGTVRWQTDEYLSGLGQAWVTILRRAGQSRHKALPPPPPPFPDPLDFQKRCHDADR